MKNLHNIILHLHPNTINEDALKLNRTFGLGGMAAFLIVIQFITGIMLRFYYEPLPGKAYDSIIHLRSGVLFGQFVRNIHHWSAVFLVIISFLHLLRVFFTGAYRYPRRINWFIGLLLLTLVVFSNFTGYLLPWDQLAYWAITVSTSILQYIPFIGNSLREFIISGSEVNADTLLRFYNFHTSIFPILLLLLMAYHFWRVRKAGGVITSTDSKKDFVASVPHLVNREFVAALVLIAVIFTFAVFFNAPLLDKANPGYSLNPTKAPWYFAGIQELLLHFHPFVAGIVIPILIVFFLVYIPFIKFDNDHTGQWFNSKVGKSSSITSALLSGLFTLLIIALNEYGAKFEILFPGILPIVSNGVFQLIIWFVIIGMIYLYIKRKNGLSKTESVQVLFVCLVTIFLLLSFTNIFLRGKDMALTLPWN